MTYTLFLKIHFIAFNSIESYFHVLSERKMKISLIVSCFCTSIYFLFPPPDPPSVSTLHCFCTTRTKALCSVIEAVSYCTLSFKSKAVSCAIALRWSSCHSRRHETRLECWFSHPPGVSCALFTSLHYVSECQLHL